MHKIGPFVNVEEQIIFKQAATVVDNCIRNQEDQNQ